MHRFNRGDSPVDFRKISRKYSNWNDFAKKEPSEHRTIRNALYKRQQHYCAYCERVITIVDSERAHIEHLERRKDVPKRTFDWKNMFLSCVYPNSCGKYKDDKGGKFNVADIIDPSEENPLDYYTFDKYGRIVAVDDATPEIIRKVEETVRIFNLNCSKLVEIRRNALRVIDDFLIQLGRRPTKDETEYFLNNLEGDVRCISVYYDYFKFHSEYEKRFA